MTKMLKLYYLFSLISRSCRMSALLSMSCKPHTSVPMQI